MLRKILFNRRAIPVPVPIRTLEEAVEWLAATLLKPDEEITRIVVDGNELDWDESGKGLPRMALRDDTRLEVVADSPLDLSVQTTEALCNLALVIERGLKTLAVNCWQTPSNQKIREVDTIQGDLLMMVNLCETVTNLIPSEIDVSVLRYLVGRMDLIRLMLLESVQQSDWQQYARILLNKLEPSLREVATEAENVQTQIYSRISQLVMTRKTKYIPANQNAEGL